MDIKKLLDKLKEKSIIQKKLVDNVLYKECDYVKGSDLPTVNKEWCDFPHGAKWGEFRDTHCWFYFKTDLPKAKSGKDLYISVKTDKSGWDGENPQLLAWLNGVCVQGLDINHTKIYVGEKESAEVYLYAYSGTPSYTGQNGKFSSSLEISVVEIDKEIEGLYYDLSVPYNIVEYLDESSQEYSFLHELILKALRNLDFELNNQEFLYGVKKAREILKRELYSKQWSMGETEISCIGHTHIDIAWMWTVQQAREKVQRSFATEIALMKRNEDFHFTSSQAYLYQAVKEENPALYEEIKEMVKQGKWEVEGAAWVECDTNVPNGESLVRQILYGKEFFRKEFGKECKVMWLPDVFGYSAAMPQILKKSGVDKFVTSKISWNDTNRLPNDMFMWKGIDGSEILTHFISTTSKRKGLPVINGTGYVSQANPAEIAGTYERFCPKEIADELICCYGHGDGGGGVTEEMIERIRRLKNGLPGCPKATMKTVNETFESMGKKLKGKSLPIWDGELYLEFHRGTYTTKADNKKYNRLLERLLKQAEWLCVTDYLLNGTPYPKEDLERLWKVVLLNQFHDILPGSSIKEVYDVTDVEYAQTVMELNQLISKVKERVLPKVGKGETVIVNSTNAIKDRNVGEYFVCNIPSFGFKKVALQKKNTSTKVKARLLENKYYRIKFNKNGQIESFVYKPLKREVLKGSKGNVLFAYKDTPKEYEAWNIDKDYIESGNEVCKLVESEIIETAGKVGLKFKWEYGNSVISQNVLLDDSQRVDFETTVDWNEKETLLKALFPLDVNTSKAVYEIQFGRVERTTHNNTSWDEAQFEVPAQRYAYLAENGFGVALLNDCKYGYSAKNNVLGLSLLRATNYPCRNADVGTHKFTYSIVCGGENFADLVVSEAENLNNPIETCFNGKASCKDEFSLVEIDTPNILVSSIKMSEDMKGIVVRLYETTGKRTACKVGLGYNYKYVYNADLQENKIDKFNAKNNTVTIQFKPYEIITLFVEI